MSEQLLKTPCTFGDNGNFLLERELGSGGMGGVYMGRDKMLDRPVAVKVMLREYGSDAEFVGKFKKEAQAAAKLIHPNIAQVYSYGISDGMPYIAMELVAGGSLWTVMQASGGKTDVTRVLKVCQQVAQALQCSTDQGFVHGDIKPENILLDANGNAKIVDFGLAGMQKDTSEIWGTPYYIAPEKVRQEGVDFRADMYSLGGTLYHALTNVPPFEGADVTAVVKARFYGTPKKPSEIRPDLTPAVDALVMRMLELDKEKRFPSFEALIEEFKRVLTTGLERAGAAPVEKGGAAAPRPATAVRSGRRMSTVPRRTSAAAAKPSVPEIDNQKDEDEEEGGSLGVKVVGAIAGGVLLIGAVIGGLVWFKTSAANAKAERARAECVQKIDAARKSIADTRATAVSLAARCQEDAERAVAACKSSTDELKKLLPAWAGEMQPPQSAELTAAIAATAAGKDAGKDAGKGAAAQSPADSAAAQSAADMERVLKAMEAGLSNAQIGTLALMAKQVGLPPPPEDFDPKSPDTEDYLKQLQAALERAKADGKLKVPEAAAPAQAAAETPSAPDRPAVLDDLRELWNRAYGCQASAIRVGLLLSQVVADCDATETITGEDRETVERLAQLSVDLKGRVDAIKATKDFDNARTGAVNIEKKGGVAVRKTVNRLRLEDLQKKREEEKAKAAAEEQARQEAAAAAKQELVERETAAAKGKFDALVAQGVFAQLDWDSALRQLKSLKEGCRSVEGGFAADHEIRKVEAMKTVQDIFKENLPGYVFKGSKLKGNKVRKVDATMVDTIKADGRTPQKLTWRRLYKEFHGNLNELINTFVVKGRDNGKKRLNLQEWANAMCGAALTMRIVCGDSPAAVTYGEKLVKDVAAAYPDYGRNLKAMFPDIDLEGAAEAAE